MELLRYLRTDKGTFHLRRQQIIMIFDPDPPLLAVFYSILPVGKFGQFLIPHPLKNADVLNGWVPIMGHSQPILAFFEHLPRSVDIFNLMNVDKKLVPYSLLKSNLINNPRMS